MLTRRQIEILNLIKLGNSNKAMASELTISINTIKHHMSMILMELEAEDRAHAV